MVLAGSRCPLNSTARPVSPSRTAIAHSTENSSTGSPIRVARAADARISAPRAAATSPPAFRICTARRSAYRRESAP